jgi:hypothetical protein
MQLQTGLCFGYTYGVIFIAQFLKTNVNFYSLRVNPPPPTTEQKILVVHLQ